MQISNASLAQFVGNSVNLSQSGNRPSAKPVTIEGQLVDDEQNRAADKQTISSVLDRSGSESQTQLIQPPSAQESASGNFSNAFLSQELSQELSQGLSQQLLLNNHDSAQTPSFVLQNDLSQQDSSSLNNSFPYTNRRSFEGLAGSSLVIQTYLNNESPDNNQSAKAQGNINFFV